MPSHAEAAQLSPDQRVARGSIPLLGVNVDDSVYYVLERDQCSHGFQHTEDKLIWWLGTCDTWARKSLVKRIMEFDKKLDKVGR